MNEQREAVTTGVPEEELKAFLKRVLSPDLLYGPELLEKKKIPAGKVIIGTDSEGEPAIDIERRKYASGATLTRCADGRQKVFFRQRDWSYICCGFQNDECLSGFASVTYQGKTCFVLSYHGVVRTDDTDALLRVLESAQRVRGRENDSCVFFEKEQMAYQSHVAPGSSLEYCRQTEKVHVARADSPKDSVLLYYKTLTGKAIHGKN